MLSLLKAAVLDASKHVTLALEPFEPFTRPAQPLYPEALAVKAQRFEADYFQNFTLYQGQIWNYRIPVDRTRPAPWDVGDQAIWHGVMQAGLAFQYAATKDPETAKALAAGVRGLILHQTIHGEKYPRLVRGIYEDGTFQDEASNDSATGHLAGIYFTWKYGPVELRPLCQQLIANFAWELIAHDYSLVRADGSPTDFGRLIQGPLTDPLRLTLCLAILGAAHMMTTEPAFYQHFYPLFKKYRAIIPYAKTKFMWWDTYYDTHRAALHLTILADMQPMGEIHQAAAHGLQNLLELEERSGNAWVIYLIARHVPPATEVMNQCRKMLSEFCVELRGPDTERINSTRTDFKKVLWNGRWMAAQPLPRHQVANHDFFWRCNLHSIDDHVGNKSPGTIYSGMDFLVAYWLGRQLGTLAESE